MPRAARVSDSIAEDMEEHAMSRRSAGEGSLTQRADGRWQAALQVEGRRRTRAAAAQRLQELIRQAAQAGALPDPGKRTVGELLDAWLDTKAPTVRPRTLADYAAVCWRHVPASFRAFRLAKVGPDRIARFCARLQARGQHRTALNVFRCLDAALALAARWGWLTANPCDRVDPTRYRPERREVWTAAELARFLEGTHDHWQYPLWTLLARAGLRTGEPLALEYADVVLARGAGKMPKSVGQRDSAHGS